MEAATLVSVDRWRSSYSTSRSRRSFLNLKSKRFKAKELTSQVVVPRPKTFGPTSQISRDLGWENDGHDDSVNGYDFTENNTVRDRDVRGNGKRWEDTKKKTIRISTRLLFPFHSLETSSLANLSRLRMIRWLTWSNFSLWSLAPSHQLRWWKNLWWRYPCWLENRGGVAWRGQNEHLWASSKSGNSPLEVRWLDLDSWIQFSSARGLEIEIWRRE